MNIINYQFGDVLYDCELNNGSTYYYYPNAANKPCHVINFGVGILKPNWLAGATYLGEASIDSFLCDVWQKGTSPVDASAPFLTYYNAQGTDYPVRWVFFDGASFDVLKWAVNQTADEMTWKVPLSCTHGHRNTSEFLTRPAPWPIQGETTSFRTFLSGS